MSFADKIREYFDAIPNRRLPLGKNAWLQEWGEAEEMVLKFHDEVVAGHKQKLLKLGEIIKSRPSHKWIINNLDKAEEVEIAFQRIEKKFGLLLKELEK